MQDAPSALLYQRESSGGMLDGVAALPDVGHPLGVGEQRDVLGRVAVDGDDVGVVALESCPDLGAWGPRVAGALAVAASMASSGV